MILSGSNVVLFNHAEISFKVNQVDRSAHAHVAGYVIFIVVMAVIMLSVVMLSVVAPSPTANSTSRVFDKDLKEKFHRIFVKLSKVKGFFKYRFGGKC
jgi:hypothetical protein